MASAAQGLSASQARRIALAAQGFTDGRHVRPTMRTLVRAVRRTGLLQVDSVNVLQRAHYMPLWSRMGAYDPELLTRASQHRPRRLVEYFAHVQALMPVELWPVMRHRMDHYREQRGKWGFSADPEIEPQVLAAVRARGPVTARDLDEEFSGPRTREHWGWNWSEARKVLDYLFLVGDVAVAGRSSQFEVTYDVPERVLPPQVLAAATPSVDEAARELVRRASRSLGVASLRSIADYYRMPQQPVRAMSAGRAVAELVEAGELREVRVQGWHRPAYRHVDATLPRRVAARTLLSPFDPVVWERERTEQLFDFHYRIEIYVPKPQRRYGYYVLPFLLGDRVVARVDLKADRTGSRLLVKGAYAEVSAPEETGAELAAELRDLADWLGLADVVVEPRGDLAPAIAAAF